MQMSCANRLTLLINASDVSPFAPRLRARCGGAADLWSEPMMPFRFTRARLPLVIGLPIAGACVAGVALHYALKRPDSPLLRAALTARSRPAEPLFSGWPYRPWARPRDNKISRQLPDALRRAALEVLAG